MREVKDAKDLNTGKLVYLRGHAKATFMSDGRTVEDAISSISTGSGGEVQKTTEAEILAMGFTKNAGTITEVKMNGVSKGTSGVVDLGAVITEHQDISGKVDKVNGKQLTTEDFTTALKNKLESIAITEPTSAPVDYMSGEHLVNFYTSPMQPDVAYVAEIPINAIYNLSIAEPQTLSATYTLHFTMASVVGIFIFPDNLLWANGEIPTIEPNVSYELSIVATKLAEEYIYKAVLTPFKAA